MSELDEILADARAEEEVKKEQFKKKWEEVTKNAKDTLRESLSKEKILIDKDEYLELKLLQADFTRIMDAIFNNAEFYSYSDSLGIDSRFMDTIKALYPRDYAKKLAQLKKEAE